MNYSVLMSVYAKVSPDELKTSVDSMLGQTVKPEQFVMVLDGELPESLMRLVRKFESENKDLFTIVPLKDNVGLAAALNAGMAVARNELVARMDSDDYSLPERCEKQLQYFKHDKDLALLGTDTAHFLGQIDNVLPMTKARPHSFEGIKKTLRRYSPFAHPSVMFKKSAVLACGGYDPILRRRQDYDLFSKMVNGYNYKAENIPEVLLLFRADEGFLIRNKNWDSCKSRIKVQRRIYKRGECTLGDYLYIVISMVATFILPVNVYKKLYSNKIKKLDSDGKNK